MIIKDQLSASRLLFGTIFLLANRLQVVMDQQANELTCKQWFVLTILQTFKRPPTLQQLAKQCDSSHQNVKQIVMKLQSKGFLEIINDPLDKRAMRIVATSRYEQWYQENSDVRSNFTTSLFQGINQQQIETMAQVQTLLYTNLEEMRIK